MNAAAAPPVFDRRSFPPTAQIASWCAADGWALRWIRWGAPDAEPRGSLLFVGGRGDHAEKYLEAFEDWRRAGWHVETFDWRGQGGSGRLSADPHVGHATDFGPWVDDIAGFVADWRARTPGPHMLVAHSMGGHLVLRALGEHRLDVDAVALVAPMLGFLAPYPNGLGRVVAQFMARLGRPDRPGWKVSEKPGEKIGRRITLLTHDADRYADELWWQQHDPKVALGPASWTWIAAAYRSFQRLAAPGFLEGVSTPICILATRADKLVSFKAIEQAAARLPHARLHVYGDEAAHELLREADAIRSDALARIDSFFRESGNRA